MERGLSLLFFVLLAFGFWLLQSLQQEYDIKLTFPIKYKNVPANIAFNTPNPEKITAKVKDKGSVLLNYSFGASFSPIEINLKEINDNSGSIMIEKKFIENEIQKQLIASTFLHGLDPQQINISYSKRSHKRVPVVFNGDIKMETGFQLSDDITITPQYVSVYASEETLDSIHSIKTQYCKFSESKKHIKKDIALENINGVKFDPEIVSVSIPIEEYTEKTLDIPVICDKVPSKYKVRMFPATIKVTCSIPLSRFKELSEDMFEISIPYDELERNASGIITVSLTKRPEWVHAATLQPQKAEFILEKNQ